MRNAPVIRNVCRLWVLVVPLLILVGVVSPARAQLMHLDPIPFFTPADSTSRLALEVDANRFHDDKFKWSLNRILLTAVLPAGDDGTFFLRLSHLTFDSGEIPLSSRWPWALGAEGQDGWPHEKRTSSFGKMEIGVTGPAVLPLVRGIDYGLALGLPTGSDRVYPFSAQSLPFRIQVRKPVVLGGGLQAGFSAGYLLHMASGKDFLDESAFPNGYSLGASLAGYGRPGARWHLTWDYRNEDSRESQLVGVQGWVPWTRDGSVGVKVAAEIAGTLDRPAAWYFTLSWRFDSFKYRQGREDKPELED